MAKVALVLEGGALRGIFTAGVVDCFLDHGIKFDYVVGVSAGSCNLMSMVSRTKGLFKSIVLNPDKDERFYGLRQMAESHKLLNLRKLFYDSVDNHNFNMQSLIDSKTKWEMVVTNMETGQAEYMHSNKDEQIRLIGTASCSMPLITELVEINGKMYSDGGMADSIPIERALEKGYDRIVVVSTRRKNSFSKTSEASMPLLKQVYKQYPKFIKTLQDRGKHYKKQIGLCEKLEKQGKVVLIRPTLPEISKLESDIDELSLFYYHGYTKAEEYIDDIKHLKRIIYNKKVVGEE